MLTCAAQVRSAHALQGVVVDLKQAVLLKDFHALNESVAQRGHSLYAQSQTIAETLALLRDDLGGLLTDLDAVFYSTAPPPSADNGEDRMD